MSARAAGVLERLSADAILERLAAERAFPGPMTFDESSVVQRTARGDLAADAIRGFHSLTLDDPEAFPRGTDVNKIVFWVAESAADADEFFAQEVESLDESLGVRRTGTSVCSSPADHDPGPPTCLAVVDKVVLMTVAPDRPDRILDDGVLLLAGLDR
ncbi:MAG: hypothetical protein M3134_08890 [Actinomycetota bacterium]|nr:hypothetical protein [Actinomycetota bacterium]